MNQAGRLATALGVAVSGLVFAAPSAFAADVTVRPADLAAHTSWVVSPFNTDIAGIGALADPIHFDGSAHLQVTGPTQRAQLALPLNSSLADIARRPLSYQVYVDPAGSDPAVISSGVSLQLQVHAPTFTTLSFQPALDGGAVAGAWRTFTSSDHAPVWRTSRQFGPYPAGSDHSLADYINAEPHPQVNGAFLNIGTGPTELNAYTDNVALDGNTYNFATAGSAHASLSAATTLNRGKATPISLSFTSPSDGPMITDASAEFTVSGPPSLRDRSLTLEKNGAPLALHREVRGRYSAQFTLSGETLDPGSSLTADLSLLLGRRAPCGTYTFTGRLLSNHIPTGLTASETLTLACPTTPPSTPPTSPPPTGPTHPGRPTGPTHPGWPTRPGKPGGGLPPTGSFGTAGLLWSSVAALGIGLALFRTLRRHGAH